MIFPIGHEETRLRRVPWISFGIMLVCLLALVGTKADGGSAGSLDRNTQELNRYFIAHPYLDLDTRTKARIFPGMGEQKREAFVEALRQTTRRPDDPHAVEAEQAEIDRLARAVLDGSGQRLLHRWGLVPARFGIATLFTHMFLHAGWIHLLGNLFILYLAGPYVEDVWGRPLFAAFYITSGLVAALTFVLRYPVIDVPLVGASGAISGLMGAFLVRYARTKIRFAYLLGLRLRGTFDAPAWLMLPLWLLQQLFFASMDDTGAGGGVAHLAHVGGFGFGVVVALTVRRLDIERRYVDRRIEFKTTTVHVDRPALEKALGLKTQGRVGEAFDLLKLEAARSASDRDVALAFWDVAVDLDRASEAAPAMVSIVQHELRSGEGRLAAEHWIELKGRVPDVALEPRTRVALAQALLQACEREEAMRMITAAMKTADAGMEPGVALRMIRVASQLEDDLCRRAGALVLARTDLGPDVRGQVERLLAGASPIAPLSVPRNSAPQLPQSI